MSEDDVFLKTLHLWAETFTHTSMHAFIQHNRASGLSMSQVNSLFRIYHHGPSSVNDLAEHLGVTKAAVSQLLDRLVLDDLILRVEDSRDRRSKQILLTEKGRQTVQEGMRARNAWVGDLAQALTPEEKVMILPALSCMINRFGNNRAHDLIGQRS
jgi:DNA-binding MarR family transcriptional regulator